ncbi:unnamed protein product, partial [Ixodes hexagonus]
FRRQVRLNIKYSTWTGCGGVILTAWHVLTAAHCVQNISVFGVAHALYPLTWLVSKNQKKIISSFVPFNSHQCYFAVPPELSLTCSLGLVEKGRTGYLFVNFSGYGGFMLVSKFEIATTFFRGSTKELRYTNQVVWSTEECEKKLKFFNGNTSICAYHRYSDACSGDSGGPLVLKSEDKFFLVGLVSMGMGCNRLGMPGGYTRVTTYLRWIERVLNHSTRYLGLKQE